jgi:predicted aspartyl protease
VALEAGGRLGIGLSIYNVYEEALIDTGASLTLLRADTWADIVERTGRPNFLRAAPHLCSVNGEKLEVLGTANIKIDNLPRQDMVIVKNISHRIIIGDDFLINGKANISYSTATLTWFDLTWQMNRYQGHKDLIHVVSLDAPIPKNIDEVMGAYSDIFTDKAQPLGFCDIMPLEIDTGDARPIRQRSYRAPLSKREEIERQIQHMLKEGIIVHSSSPWASPITLQMKSSGDMRFCIDFRKLNSVTKKDSYPLPLIQDIFDQLGGMEIFTTLDLNSGFWQTPIRQEDQYKTAFICHAGQYQFLRMPFGLANGPAQFQRLMDHILQGLLGVCVMVYIDDLVVFSKDAIAHARDVQLVFQRLREAGLTLNPAKCKFGQPSVKLLGHIIDKEGIRNDPAKVQAINELPPPKDVHGVRSFLGMTGKG